MSPSCGGRVRNVHDRLVHNGRVYSGFVEYTRRSCPSQSTSGAGKNRHDGGVLNIHDRRVDDGRVYSGSVKYTRRSCP